MRYDYDMLGNRIHQASMEAGERWMLNDVTGKPIRAWDSRGHQFRTTYDACGDPPSPVRDAKALVPELLVERTVYGETRLKPEASNLRGKVFQVFDQAGVVTSEDYDFKGNLLRSQRQLAPDYKHGPGLGGRTRAAGSADVFTSSTTYDALNRPVTADHAG